jgi:hypothetical protein
MTTDLQQAMARYEEARIEYKKAVLASLHEGAVSNGESIRLAIRKFQATSAELKRLRREETLAVPVPTEEEQPALPGWGFVLKLLKAS